MQAVQLLLPLRIASAEQREAWRRSYYRRRVRRCEAGIASKAKHSTLCRAYKKKNKKKIQRQNRLYKRRRLATDPVYRLTYNLRRRMLLALRGKNKSNASITLLGCTAEQLRVHLESLFTEGMTWENYSLKGWHVDHIRPCASFDLSDPDQQKQCFHWTNLKPMWAADNIRKGAKWKPTNLLGEPPHASD